MLFFSFLDLISVIITEVARIILILKVKLFVSSSSLSFEVGLGVVGSTLSSGFTGRLGNAF
ncbi:MAG: hypothetical protein ACTSSL_13205 [Candidatus Heimdallarchaeaceae archaeon]